MNYKRVTKCRACGSRNLVKYLDLGEVPLANGLQESFDSSIEKYPIEMLACIECHLSMLSVVVSPEKLYTNYPYHSSVSQTFKDHCRAMAVSIKSILSEKSEIKNPLVIDIASNDGCLLKEFKAEGFNVMGVEPSKNLAAEAEKNGISTVDDFWHEDSAARIPACDVITATNVFAHVDDIRTFVKLAKEKLRLYSKGMLVIEVPYLMNMFEGNQFDTIYHEHLSYFLLGPLVAMFSDLGCPIFRVERIPIHGGGIRIYSSPWGYEEDPSVMKLLCEERDKGYYEAETYDRFASGIESVVRDLPFLLFSLLEKGKKVVGYGASAKGISLLNYCDIESRYMNVVIDETPDKQGKLTPGSNAVIAPFSQFEIEKPDYILLLAWNFSKELIEKTKHLGAKYIIPIPTVTIL